MERIPGENSQIARNREDRADARRDPDVGPAVGRDTPPCCCHCQRALGPGIRYSWTNDARMQCGACSGPGDTLLTFT